MYSSIAWATGWNLLSELSWCIHQLPGQQVETCWVNYPGVFINCLGNRLKPAEWTILVYSSIAWATGWNLLSEPLRHVHQTPLFHVSNVYFCNEIYMQYVHLGLQTLTAMMTDQRQLMVHTKYAKNYDLSFWLTFWIWFERVRRGCWIHLDGSLNRLQPVSREMMNRSWRFTQ